MNRVFLRFFPFILFCCFWTDKKKSIVEVERKKFQYKKRFTFSNGPTYTQKMIVMSKSVNLLLVVAFASFLFAIDAACIEREPKEGNVTETTMEKLANFFAEASCQLRPVAEKVKEEVKNGYEYLKFKFDEYNSRNKTEIKHIRTDNVTIVIINQSNCNNDQDRIVFKSGDDPSNKLPKTTRIEPTESSELFIFKDSDEEVIDSSTKIPITTVRTKPQLTIEPKIETEPTEPVYVPTSLPTTTESIEKIEPKSTIVPKVITAATETIIFRDDDSPINLSTSLPLKFELPTTTTETTVTTGVASTTLDITLDDRIALSAPEMCPNRGDIRIDGKCRQEIQL